jgi:hypothetical protein
MPLDKLNKFKKGDEVTVQVRAIASDGQVQNSTLQDLYNIRGICNNANHIVKFKLPK